MRYEDVRERLLLCAAERGQGAIAEEIERAERELDVILPDGYRSFLRELGWAAIGHHEIYGLGAEVPYHLDLIRVTMSERTEALPLTPPWLVPVMNDGAGNLHCLDTSRLRHGECPVVFWDHELGEAQVPDDVAEDLPSWLAALLDEGGGP
ncbi:MAG: SMI1/KNR4 family protein [Actinomycetota bacterium]|nr:SMI1/KNR4 family protein [Actinomycetota bacterium]